MCPPPARPPSRPWDLRSGPTEPGLAAQQPAGVRTGASVRNFSARSKRSFSDLVNTAQVVIVLHAVYSCGMLDFAAQYAALRRRDPALDGVVFVAVKTTGIYC